MTSILNQKMTMLVWSIVLRLFRVNDSGRPSAPIRKRCVGWMSAADSRGRSSARSGLRKVRKSGTTVPPPDVSRFVATRFAEADPVLSNDDVALNGDHDNPHASPRENPAPRRRMKRLDSDPRRGSTSAYRDQRSIFLSGLSDFTSSPLAILS